MNPLIENIPEKVSLTDFFQTLGFEVEFDWLDDYDPDANGDEILRDWDPTVPKDFHLAVKYWTEEGPYACFVKPKTQMAREIWAAGVREELRRATEGTLFDGAAPDMRAIVADCEHVISKHLGGHKPGMAIAITIPPEYQEVHWITNLRRSDGIQLITATANKMRAGVG